MTGVGITYFGGNEPIGFITTGTVSPSTNGQTFRPAWSRVSLVVGGGAAADPPTNYFSPALPFTPNASMWTHAQLAWTALGGSSDLNVTLLEWLDSSNIPRIMVRGAGGGAVKISKRNAAGTFTDLVSSAASALPSGGLTTFPLDVRVVYSGAVTAGARTDVSFAAGPPGVISRVSGNFVTDGFLKNGLVTVLGSASNDGVYEIDTVAATSITLITNQGLNVEAAGATVTLTSTGRASVYFGDNLVCTYNGDTTTDGITALQQVRFANCSISTGALFWSEMIISDTNTINAGLFTLSPVAAGTTQQFTGVVASIAKVLIDDTTAIMDGTAGDLSGWTTPIVFPLGVWTVQSIIQEARAAVGTTGPTHFDWYCRTADGSDHLGGANNAPTPFFGNFSGFIWALNPHTAAPWAVSDITTGFNLGVKALA